MPKNIDPQKKRRRNAVLSAALSALWQIAAAVVFFLIRAMQDVPQWLWWLLTVCAAADLLMLIPLGVSLKQRLNEIDGGEENEAGKY